MMEIGVIGTGNIGGTLIAGLSAAGHDVMATNSRGPQGVPAELLEHGVRAVSAEQAFKAADVVILSIPLHAIAQYAALAQAMDPSVTLIDTSNYYPGRDGQDFLEDGALESGWVQERLGRPIVKAFNTIGPDSLASGGSPDWVDGVIALPVAGDRPQDVERARVLIEDLGLEAHHSGPISESWRQQPGNPVYGTDLTLAELPEALAGANRRRAPRLRDLFVAIVVEHMEADTPRNPPARWGTELSRLLYMPEW